FVGEIPTRESVSSPRDIGAFPTRNPAVADTLDRVTASRQFFHASAIASAAAIHYHLFSPEIHAHHPPVARSGGPGVRRGFFLRALRFFSELDGAVSRAIAASSLASDRTSRSRDSTRVCTSSRFLARSRASSFLTSFSAAGADRLRSMPCSV